MASRLRTHILQEQEAGDDGNRVTRRTGQGAIVSIICGDSDGVAVSMSDYHAMGLGFDSLRGLVFSSALHWAAKHGNENVVKLIAGTHNADVNARTTNANVTIYHTGSGRAANGRLLQIIEISMYMYLFPYMFRHLDAAIIGFVIQTIVFAMMVSRLLNERGLGCRNITVTTGRKILSCQVQQENHGLCFLRPENRRLLVNIDPLRRSWVTFTALLEITLKMANS
ncbi:hypothetical protein AAG570_012162 [Ranatra chinensis]|uniref:Uncharacterized protein n=1 Tax=Ranatra chinensis TaxID=642074 RepID=A0ABD0YHZ4_9HEMI